ncbi:MAG: iron ABC transporter permease, partial [Longimicrobiales bacterium]|nr:iron ABC transporter permease [Longimicrobiales bacterium]
MRNRPRNLRRKLLAPGLGIGLVALGACMLFSMATGAARIPLDTVLSSLVAPDGSIEHLTVRTLRLPRAVVAIAVGASLGLAGAVMQGLTRNPLASPGILGVNAGAALAVVGATFLVGVGSPLANAALAFLGAGVTAVVVYLMGSLGGAAPASVKLVLAGAAVTALLTSLTTAVLLVDQQTLEQIRFWLAGSVAGRDLELFFHLLPFLGAGMIVALFLGKPITTLSLGEDVARGLGQHTGRVKLVAAGSVALLAGSAVAVAGPIGFIGLVIPNAVRPLVGRDYRWILPYSAIAGAILLLVADMAARVVIRPEEMPVGVMTALIGGP